MTLSLIGVGSAANDGTGDPLRTAFQTINTAITLINNAIDVQTGYTLFKDDGGSAGVVVDSAGDVAIGGITSPAAVFHVSSDDTLGTPAIGPTAVGVFQNLASTASDALVHVLSGSSGTASIYFGDENNATEGSIRYDNANNSMQLYTSLTERMRLNADGFLGLNTDAPGALLHVVLNDTNGTPTLGGDDAGVFQNTKSTTSPALIRVISGSQADAGIFFGDENNGGPGSVRYKNSTNSMGIYTQFAEAISITSSQDVGIGETAPDYKLDVNGTFGFTPGTSVTPVDNGDVVFEFTNNTTFTINAKGTDGTVRSGTVTLS